MRQPNICYLGNAVVCRQQDILGLHIHVHNLRIVHTPDMPSVQRRVHSQKPSADFGFFAGNKDMAKLGLYKRLERLYSACVQADALFSKPMSC